MGSRARFRDVLAIGEFRALWAAELLSIAGDQLARVALAVLVYQRTSSASLTALTYALTLVPALLGGALLSGLADRHPRRELMVGVDLVRAAVAGAMVLPFLPLPALMGLVFVLALAGGPFKAAQQALLPTVLPGEKYVIGLSLRTVTNQAAQVAGFVGGGVLLTVLDPRLALGLNAGTFLVAAVVIGLGVRHRQAARASAATGADADGVGGTVRLIWRDRRLRGLVGLSWLVGLFVVPEGLAAPYAAGLGVAALAVGMLMAADPVGSIVGAWLIARYPKSRLTTPLAIAAGLPLAACIFRPGLAVSIGLWAISGACSTAYLILAQASFTRQIPDHHRGAASGLASTGVWSSQGIAILGGGVLADATSPVFSIACAGAAGAILAALVGSSWLRARASGSRARRSGGREAGDVMTADDVTSPSSPSSAPPPAEPAAEHGTGGADQVIIAGQPASASGPIEGPSRALRNWALWKVPRRVLVFIVVVEAAGVGITVVLAERAPIGAGALITFGFITGLGVAMAEMSRHVERIRRRFNDTPHVNLTSVWTIPAALLLPPVLIAAVVVTLYLHLFWRSWYRVRGVHAYRLTFSATVAVLACYATWLLRHALAPDDLSRWDQPVVIGSVLLAVLAYPVVNSVMVATAITLFEGKLDLRRSLGTGRENALEFGTLGLGAATTVLISFHPVWSLTIVPALLVLHRSVLMRQWEEASATDPKTGLTNAAAWTNMATKELERAARDGANLGVLMVDLDRFKLVNDTHGHLVGDEVLQAIADTLSDAVRRHDLVGRWGGEEFVVLCPEVSREDLVGIGKRICELVRGLRVSVSAAGHGGIIGDLTVSIGAATFPEFGPELQDVLLAADDALFVAKDRGRDQVQSIVDAIDGHGHKGKLP